MKTKEDQQNMAKKFHKARAGIHDGVIEVTDAEITEVTDAGIIDLTSPRKRKRKRKRKTHDAKTLGRESSDPVPVRVCPNCWPPCVPLKMDKSCPKCARIVRQIRFGYAGAQYFSKTCKKCKRPAASNGQYNCKYCNWEFPAKKKAMLRKKKAKAKNPASKKKVKRF